MPRVVAWLATFAIGCGQPSSGQTARPPAPPTTAVAPDAAVDAAPSLADDLPALALRARQLYLDWAAAFRDPNLDCPTATARVNELANKNADVAAANRDLYKAGHERIKLFKAELAKYDAEIAPAAKLIGESPIMQRCMMDPAFSRAVERLGGEG